MRELKTKELLNVGAGRKFNWGRAAFAGVAGFLLGGPVGAGIALSAVVGEHHLNSLGDMAAQELAMRHGPH